MLYKNKLKYYGVLLTVLVFCLPVFGQEAQRVITGLITESTGDPIIGGTVTIVGDPSRGGITDMNGKFSIRAANGEELQFRFMGFRDEIRTVRQGVNTINVRMEVDAELLDEVVVIGYGQQKKESVVASMTSIGPDELTFANRSLNNSIAGKISGVIAVQRSGEPGWDDAQFWIRGVSSYAGGTDPLVLVDGVPRSMSNIDVDEIESFTVLKDAAATAVYGAEGANGVILVTSKRGKSQKTTINVSAEHRFNTPLRLPNLLDSYQYLSLFNEAAWNNAGNPEAGFIWPTPEETLEKYRTGADRDLYPSTDWMDMLKDVTHSSRYTINFRGGGEKVRFFVSGSYMDEEGVYKKNTHQDYNSNVTIKRYNLRSNIDLDITSTTRMSVDVSGSYMNKTAPLKTADEIFNGMTLFPVHLIPMIYSDGTASEHPESDSQGLRQNPYNFLYFSGYNTNWETTINTKVSLEQQLEFITKGLSIRGNLSYDATNNQFTNRSMSPFSYNATGRNEDGELTFRLRNTGSALGNPSTGSAGGSKRIYLEAALNYRRDFGLHDVTGIIVYNQRETVTQNGSGLNLLPTRKQNVVARGTYGYDGRYMLEGSFGMTGSDNFARGHRWGLFPAVGAAWYISNEKFFEDIRDSFMNKLKLRASYGKTGNDNLNQSRFPYRESLNLDPGGYNLGLSSASNGTGQNNWGGIAEGRMATPLLRWEIEDKVNTGFDLGLFGGRIDLSVDYFYNRRHDILINRGTIPVMSGLRQGPLQNFGVVVNKGVDGNIVIKERIGNLSLTFRANYTFARNKQTERDEIPQAYEWLNQTGRSIGLPLLYIAEGLYTPDDFDITYNPVTGAQSYKLKEGLPDPGAEVAPGDIKYKDLNGDGVIDSFDQTYDNGFRGNNPESNWGISLNAEYKGFFAGVFFQGVGGTSTNLMAKAENFMPFTNGKDASSARSESLSRWTVSDPYNMNVLYPRLHSDKFDHNLLPSTWWYRDASFIRLKNVEFGYQFTRNQLKNIHMQNLRVYLQGTNLITWDKVKYWDPELGGARSGAKYPISRSWTVGLEVTF